VYGKSLDIKDHTFMHVQNPCSVLLIYSFC
jgi:hypothetical protein